MDLYTVATYSNKILLCPSLSNFPDEGLALLLCIHVTSMQFLFIYLSELPLVLLIEPCVLNGCTLTAASSMQCRNKEH